MIKVKIKASEAEIKEWSLDGLKQDRKELKAGSVIEGSLDSDGDLWFCVDGLNTPMVMCCTMFEVVK